MTRILVAHAPAAKKRAALVIEALAALGYRIEAAPVTALAPHKRKALDGAVAQAGAVVVLWSKDAAAAPVLRATADRAQAAGKLALARLDAATPPLGLSAFDLSRWGGYRDAKAWKRLLAALPKAPAGHVGAVKERAQAAAAGAGATAQKKGGALAWFAFVVVLIAAAGAGTYFAWSAGLIG